MKQLIVKSVAAGLVLMIGTSVMAIPITVGDNTSEVTTQSINDRTLVKLRDLEAILHLKMSYEESTKTVTVDNDFKVVIGEKELQKSNGEVVDMEVAAIIEDNSTYLPLRAVVQALGYKVNYLEKNINLLKEEMHTYTQEDKAYLAGLYQALELADAQLNDYIVPLVEANKEILEDKNAPKYSALYTAVADEFDVVYSKVMGVTSLRDAAYLDSGFRLTTTDLDITGVLFNYLSCLVKYYDAMAAKDDAKAMEYALQMGEGFDEMNEIMKEAIQKDLADLF